MCLKEALNIPAQPFSESTMRLQIVSKIAKLVQNFDRLRGLDHRWKVVFGGAPTLHSQNNME
jgi:hypothetical protein